MAISIERAQTVNTKMWPLPLIIVWLIWRRNRIGIAIACIGMMVMSILANSVLRGTFSQSDGFRPTISAFWSPPVNNTHFSLVLGAQILWEMVLISLLYCAFIATSLSFEWKLGKVSNRYPPHMLRAPADTMGLALWPLAIGITLQLVVWMLEAFLVLGPMGLSVPVVLPAFALCTCTTVLGASTWTKWSPIIRYILVAAYVSALALGVVSMNGPKWNTYFLLLPPVVAAALYFAVVGVRKMRAGDDFTSNIKSHSAAIDALLNPVGAPPKSAFDAICCLEGRDSRRIIGFVLLGAGIAFVAAIEWFRHSALAQMSLSQIGQIEYSFQAPMLGALVFLVISGGVFSIVSFLNSRRPTAYLFCRPEPTEAIVAAELLSALVCASQLLIIGFIVLVIGCVPIELYFNGHPQFFFFETLSPEIRTIKLGAFYALFMLLYAYRSALNIASVGLTKSWWLAFLNSQVEYFTAVILAIFALGMTSGSLPHAAQVICGIAIVKLILAAWIISQVVKKRLTSNKGFLLAGAAWLVLASAMYIEAPRFGSLHHAPFYVLIGMVIIAMPLVRLSLGPILVDRSRHG